MNFYALILIHLCVCVGEGEGVGVQERKKLVLFLDFIKLANVFGYTINFNETWYLSLDFLMRLLLQIMESIKRSN